VHHREQVSQFKLEQSGRLDLTTQKIVDAIVTQQDIFYAVHDTQITLIKALHGETVLNIHDEHEITRREIIQEIRVRLLFRSIHHTT
jgi:acyl CoA:acetate/3-ketoacid CoA transferase beta subunit